MSCPRRQRVDVETSSKNMIDGLWHVGIEIFLGWSAAAKSHHLTTTLLGLGCWNQVHGDRQGMRGQGQHRGNNVWNMCVIASQGEPRTITFMPIKSRGHQRNCLSSDINFSQMKRGHQQDVSGIELSKCVHIQTHSFTFKCVSFVCRLICPLFSSALHKFILGAWGTIIYFQEKCQVQRIV